MIRRAESALTQSGKLLAVVAPKLTIVRTGHVERSADGTKWQIPLAIVGAIGLRRVTLLTENINDAMLLLHAGHHFKLSAGLGACSVVAETRGGGGSGIAHEFEMLVKARRQFCLCITDSDRNCERDGETPTSIKCTGFATSSWVVSHIALLEREIENLLPPEITEKIIDPQQRDAWNNLAAKCAACDFDLYSYCDLKEGTLMSDVLKLGPGSPGSAFWREVVRILCQKELLDELCVDACANPEACACKIAPGFGDRVIAKAIRFLDARSAQASYLVIRDGARVKRWLDLGREVFDWCCAPAQVRS
jgi:hypothetical protein